MLELLKYGNFLEYLLFSDELSIHFLDGDLFSCSDVFPTVNFTVRTLTYAILLSEDILTHLYFYFVVHK